MVANRCDPDELADVAGRAGVRRFVFLSSVKAMGEPGDACIAEDWPALPTSAYGQAKRAAEDVLREAGARSRRYHFGEGEALAVTGVGGSAGQDRWLLTDALGSVSTEVDATATSVTARQFDA